jgi:hypothetical protein
MPGDNDGHQVSRKRNGFRTRFEIEAQILARDPGTGITC